MPAFFCKLKLGEENFKAKGGERSGESRESIFVVPYGLTGLLV